MNEGARGRVEQTGASFVKADTTDRVALEPALDGADLVVHTAAVLGEAGDMATFVRVNVGGTENVCAVAEAAGASRLVHLSSVAVWGYLFESDITEDEPPHPCGNPYIDTKGSSELVARARGATVVRPGDVYGPESTQWALRPIELMRRGQFALPGRGRGLITPVYVDDLVDCVYRALTMKEADGRAFTAWDGHAVTAKDFFNHYARMLGQDGVRTAPAPLLRAVMRAQMLLARDRSAALHPDGMIFVSRKAACPNERARRLLGWEPKVTLEEGMRRTEEWFRQEGLL